MYNLHCHSLLSDGCLLPSEVAVRYMALGYTVIAITDHADYSNIKNAVKSIVEFSSHWPKQSPIKILPGVELTHIPPEHFKPLSKIARDLGAKIIVAHGETPAEPVIKGTNRAALEADIDILAHPGLITDDEIRLAAKRNIFLEITCRSGHCETNAHVVDLALKFNAKLILNTDSHKPEDIVPPDYIIKVAHKAGLSHELIESINADVKDFLKKKGVL